MSVVSPLTTLANGTFDACRDQGLGDCLPLLVNGMATVEQSDRRSEKRHAFPYPIRMRTANRSGEQQGEESIVVLGKSLSNNCLEFYFHLAVPERWMLAALPCGEDQFLQVLIELEWCRFSHEGCYINVGKIRQVLGEFRASKVAG